MSKKARESENVQLAEDILRGKAATPHDIFDLAACLSTRERQFGYARRLLAVARQDPTANQDAHFRTKLVQQHAICTYQDPDLSDEIRFDRAVQILADCDDLHTTTDQKTLGIAGAIYKCKWQIFTRHRDLEISLQYYRRGYESGLLADKGYTAINAAFLYDVIGDTAHARKIRQEIIDAVPSIIAEKPELKEDWWFHINVAQAYFGLEQYQLASPALKAATEIGSSKGLAPEWEFENAARQIAALARLQMERAGRANEMVGSEAWNVIETFLGDRAAGVWSVFLGKVGLALSGGGFRASLFHIGVLAKLAELDLLRHVEVLSCVSGGSIVGAHYYLKVRRLLQSKKQKDINRDDYVKLVSELATEFLEGIQHDIRTRVVGSVQANLRMAFSSEYSRTERVGELYEKYLFSRADDSIREFWLDELLITPAGETEDFKPKYDNWRLQAKVPVLVLNATTLNTGHNWQFTASWMGEPPEGGAAAVDANYRLRRMYYSEAPPRFQKVRLGAAVAASACVPGLFDPLNFSGLYPDITVRLVDGGVHDNQGTSALIEQNCNVLLVSDASGQMDQENWPPRNPLGVLLRSNSILQSRVRIAEFNDVEARARASLLEGFMFIHLKKDLDADPVDWNGCEDPNTASDDARPAARGPLTSYGIRKDLQRSLAAIRTDLDCFNDAEAFALMLSGYRMTEEEFPRTLPWFPINKGSYSKWPFLAISPIMETRRSDEDSYKELHELLEKAKNSAFKVWMLVPGLKISARLILGAVIASVIVACFYWGDQMIGIELKTLGWLSVSSLTTVLIGKLFSPKLAKILNAVGGIRTQISRMVFFVALAVIGFVVAAIHISIFDRWYLRLGRIGRLMAQTTPSRKEV